MNANVAHALLADAAGDTYLAYSGYLCCPSPAIDEFFARQANPLPLGIAEPIEGNAPAPVLGLALDDSGNMIIADGTQIGVYAPSAQPWPTVAPPIATIAIGRPQSALALNQANTRLFGLNAAQNQVIAYNYPTQARSPTSTCKRLKRRPQSRFPRPLRIRYRRSVQPRRVHQKRQPRQSCTLLRSYGQLSEFADRRADATRKAAHESLRLPSASPNRPISRSTPAGTSTRPISPKTISASTRTINWFRKRRFRTG